MSKNCRCLHSADYEKLLSIQLTPYINLSLRLIDVPRKHLSNAFRHQIATLGILLDYGVFDEVTLRASVIHDILEDSDTTSDEIMQIDGGAEVLALVQEVSKKKAEKKEVFLTRIKNEGSYNAKILKCADRISNLIDLGFCSDGKFIEKVLQETEKYILPIAHEVNIHMAFEITTLIASRKNVLRMCGGIQ